MLQDCNFSLVIRMMLIREMLIRRYSPLFVNYEFIAIIVGKLDEQISKVDVFEESLLGMFIIAIAGVSN
jgi:hypothetical protein